MTQPDLQERLHSLGYDQPDSTLKQHLALLPAITLAIIRHCRRRTTSPQRSPQRQRATRRHRHLIRTVSGEENSADMIKNFNRYAGTPLKAAGIALLRIDHAGKDLTRGQRGTSAKRDDVDVVWLLRPASGNLPGKTMLTLKREVARIDWIQQDIDITRNEGPPLTHTVPTVSELSIGDTEIVNYLQDQGLWCHNITVRAARQALNRSTFTAKNQRLFHIVKWVRQYGDPQGHLKLEETTGGKHGLSSRRERGGEDDSKKGNTQVRSGEHEGNAEGKGKQGKGNIDPP